MAPPAPPAAFEGVELDDRFGAVPIPEIGFRLGMAAAARGEGAETVAASCIYRGMADDEEAQRLRDSDDVIGVFADVPIRPMLICPGSPPLGDDADVERLLCTSRLHRMGADGSSVMVAIVDSGVNMAYLASRGKTPNFDAARSWVPRAGLTPGELPVGHGTMCAYDVCIAAPNCTILDIALLQSNASGGTAMEGFLSDAVRAYNHLADIMRAPRRPGEARSLVVNNSWGMFHPSWDYPVGHPGNYSDNPNHPFNLVVGTLEGLGADILFAAGNCGGDCPDGRCQGVTTNAIYGANGHPKVLCVAGVDTTKQRVGYSSQGPGRLTTNKPDLCGYTHFAGSGVYAADGGTSAATPVVAGLVAAYRTKKPHQPGNPSVSPEAVRNLFRQTCEDLGANGFDFDHGFGVAQGCEIADRLQPPVIDLCRRHPWLCRPRPVPIDLCRRFPELCRPRPPLPRPPFPQPVPPIPPVPPRLPPRPGPIPGLMEPGAGEAVVTLDIGASGAALAGLSREELIELVYMLGVLDAQEESGGAAPSSGARETPKAGGCRCGG